MSIQFACRCGKRLKARDGQAARGTVCPRCGGTVGGPAPPPAGADAVPFSFPQATPPSAADRALLASVVRELEGPAARKAGRRARALEVRWYQCLWFPLLEWRLWLAPALALALLAGAAAFVLPRLPSAAPPALLAKGLFTFAGAVCLVGAVGFPCHFLWCALADASAGGNSDVAAEGLSVAGVLRSGLTLLIGFLAGPAIPAAGAGLFWLYAGDLAWIDRLILAELIAASVGYWLLTLASVAERRRLSDVNPLLVADLMYRLGWRAAVVTLVGSVLAFALGAAAVFGVRELHREDGVGLLWLGAFGLGGMYGGAFLFRLLGLWCYRTRTASDRMVT